MEITTTNHSGPFVALFTITMLTSSIVFIEPAPYDLLLVVLFAVALFKGSGVYISVHFWPVLCLLLFLEANVISLFFIQDMSMAGRYLIITIYCIISWIGFISIFSHFGARILPTLFKAYTIAALCAVIPSIIAYSSGGVLLDIFLYGDGDRVQGLFKDPNVFGPFLIPPALYALWRMGQIRQSKKMTGVWMIILLVLAVGVLISFSRAAWGQFILAVGIYFLLMNNRSSSRLKTLLILIAILVPVLMYIVINTNVGDLFFERISLQGYDEARFDRQRSSLNYILTYPLGFGPGQSELFLNQSTHSLFIRTLSENGLFGFLILLGFCMLTLGRSLHMIKRVDLQYKGYFVIITASLIGIIFNGLFVDTIHWRHFWLLLALPWMGVPKAEGNTSLNIPE